MIFSIYATLSKRKMNMTIKEAIKILDPETTREALAACCDKMEMIRLTDEACETACATLRAFGDPEHLRELVEAEKDGRLVVLPCKVGDTVYEPNGRGFISTYKVISIHLSAGSILVGWELVDGIYSNVNGFEVSALGKTVFLTREEAEAALGGSGKE